MDIDKFMPLIMMKMGMSGMGERRMINGTIVDSGGDNDFMNLIYGMCVMQLVNYLVKGIPEVISFGKGYVENYVKKKAEQIKTEITNEKFYSIRFEYDSKKPNDTCLALIDFMSSLDESLKLKFNQNYYVSNMEPFNLGFKDLKCKIKIIDSNPEKDSVNMLFDVYSKELTLFEIKKWITKVEDDYRIFKNNKLGLNKYYFNEFVLDIPSDGKGGYRFEMAPNKLTFTMTKFETNKSLKNIYGPEINEIYNLVDLFKNKPEWYAERGIPHTLGMLLSGPPGTGKTSTIKAIAKDTNRHIINLSLRKTTTQQQLINLFFNETINVLANGETKTYNIPLDQRLYVIEDIDCLTDVVLSRELLEKEKEKEKEKNSNNNSNNNNLNNNFSNNNFSNNNFSNNSSNNNNSNNSSTLNLSFLLNLFDGVLETPNRLLIMTSNYPDKIDSALLRPGRIDLNIKFKNCSIDTMLKMFKNFFNETTCRQIDEKYSELITPARITQILSTYYNDKEKAFNNLIKFLEKELQEQKLQKELQEQKLQKEIEEQKLQKEIEEQKLQKELQEQKLQKELQEQKSLEKEFEKDFEKEFEDLFKKNESKQPTEERILQKKKLNKLFRKYPISEEFLKPLIEKLNNYKNYKNFINGKLYYNPSLNDQIKFFQEMSIDSQLELLSTINSIGGNDLSEILDLLESQKLPSEVPLIEIPNEIPIEIPNEVPIIEVSKEISKEISKEVSKELPIEISKEVSKEVPNKVLEIISIASRFPQLFFERLSHKTLLLVSELIYHEKNKIEKLSNDLVNLSFNEQIKLLDYEIEKSNRREEIYSEIKTNFMKLYNSLFELELGNYYKNSSGFSFGNENGNENENNNSLDMFFNLNTNNDIVNEISGVPSDIFMN